MLAATTSNAKAACQPFTVYAKDTLGSDAPLQRNAGAERRPYYRQWAYYEMPNVNALSIGRFYLFSITTSLTPKSVTGINAY